ncbi:MAG: hypothetical protein HY660_07680 [Armatimonadetes bacterium]|nr:hypothetical protein [Armatimonadota bacterium]
MDRVMLQEHVRDHLRVHASAGGFRLCVTWECPIVYFNNPADIYFAQDDVVISKRAELERRFLRS